MTATFTPGSATIEARFVLPGEVFEFHSLEVTVKRTHSSEFYTYMVADVATPEGEQREDTVVQIPARTLVETFGRWS